MNEETKIALEETVRKIYKIAQSCPILDTKKDPKEEAVRLDKCVQDISDFCDNFLADLKKQ